MSALNELQNYTFVSKYARWLEDKNRRETWKEAIIRAVNYNMNIAINQSYKNNINPPLKLLQEEAEILFDNIFNLRQFLSGRTHWIGGAESNVADKVPLANFNCSFIDVTKWEDMCDLFYLLLIGTGVGFRCTKENAMFIEPIRTDYEIIHSCMYVCMYDFTSVQRDLEGMGCRFDINQVTS